MTGARTPGRTHGAVPAAFVSRSAEIRVARRSRRRTASSRHSVRFFRAAPPIPAGARRLSEPDGSNPPLRVSTGCGVFGEWAGNGCGNAGRTNCVPCVGSAEQKRSATPPGDGRMRPISRSIRFPHPGKSYQSENARQAFLFKQAVFSG